MKVRVLSNLVSPEPSQDVPNPMFRLCLCVSVCLISFISSQVREPPASYRSQPFIPAPHTFQTFVLKLGSMLSFPAESWGNPSPLGHLLLGVNVLGIGFAIVLYFPWIWGCPQPVLFLMMSPIQAQIPNDTHPPMSLSLAVRADLVLLP